MPDVLKDETYYLEHQDEFDALSEEDRMKLLISGYGPVEGDTETKDEQTEDAKAEPEAAEEPERDETPEVAPEEVQEEPVVVAKDGKHTIPFSELEDARARAQYWEQVAREQLASKPAEPEPKATETEQLDVRTLRKMANEALIEGDLDKANELQAKADEEVMRLAEERAAKLLEPMQKRTQEAAVESHFKAIRDKHADFDDLVNSQEVEKWIATQPSIVRDAYLRAYNEGTTEQVIELFDTYKGQKEVPPPAPAPDKDAIARKAAEAIAKVKKPVPNSLSDIPAGTKAPSDEAEAIRSMSSTSLMDKFAGKTPDQIMELMSRVI